MLLICLMLLCCGHIFGERYASAENEKKSAESGNQDVPQDIDYDLSYSVEFVRVTVTVTDKKGRFVTDLSKNDFIVLRDGIPQEIKEVTKSYEAPTSLVILLDVSGSMRILDKFDNAKEAVTILINYLKEEDEAALLLFADAGLEVGSLFTKSKTKLKESMKGVKAYGKTALLDAVAAVPEIARKGEHVHKAVLLFTDGIDNASNLELKRALLLTRRINIPVYSIGIDPIYGEELPPNQPDLINREMLKEIASATGGKCFMVGEPHEMKRACDVILKELGSQYIIGFNSAMMGTDKIYREIEVRVKKRKYRVRSQKGYLTGSFQSDNIRSQN